MEPEQNKQNEVETPEDDKQQISFNVCDKLLQAVIYVPFDELVAFFSWVEGVGEKPSNISLVPVEASLTIHLPPSMVMELMS